jgi:hypothetical protein
MGQLEKELSQWIYDPFLLVCIHQQNLAGSYQSSMEAFALSTNLCLQVMHFLGTFGSQSFHHCSKEIIVSFWQQGVV